jgi:hypothetical protein
MPAAPTAARRARNGQCREFPIEKVSAFFQLLRLTAALFSRKRRYQIAFPSPTGIRPSM